MAVGILEVLDSEDGTERGDDEDMLVAGILVDLSYWVLMLPFDEDTFVIGEEHQGAIEVPCDLNFECNQEEMADILLHGNLALPYCDANR